MRGFRTLRPCIPALSPPSDARCARSRLCCAGAAPPAFAARARAARGAMAALSPQISLLLALGGATVGILVVLVYCVYECPGINTTSGDYMSRRRLLEAYLD